MVSATLYQNGGEKNMKTILFLLCPILVIAGCAKRYPLPPPPGTQFDLEREYNNYEYRRDYSGRYQTP